MRIEVGDVALNVVVEGEGPAAVLLLHGWLDSSHLWRHQVAALAGAGYRVVAPDLRGFGESDRPEGVEHYGLLTLAGDVLGVLDSRIGRAHVVGHDWGAALAWLLASFSPERVERLVALSVGHPASFRDAGFDQREKSWYMLLFQFVGVAEEWLAKDDWANLRAFAAGHRDLDRCVADLSRPGALAASLNLYRANVPPESLVADPVPFPPVAAPTLGVWSTGDRYLTEASMLASADHVSGPWRYERLTNATHWMQLDQPKRLNKLLMDFLGEG